MNQHRLTDCLMLRRILFVFLFGRKLVVGLRTQLVVMILNCFLFSLSIRESAWISGSCGNAISFVDQRRERSLRGEAVHFKFRTRVSEMRSLTLKIWLWF